MAIQTPRTREQLARLLAPMRLEASLFERAVAVAAAESRTFSPGAPKSAPEITRWLRTVESVHEGLMLLRNGWQRLDPHNLPYFLHPEANMGLVVSSGDQFTGITFGSPNTRNPKGAEFSRRVEDNARVPLFEYPTGDARSESEVEVIWVVLYDERDGLVHLELSLPASMAGSQIDKWSERIIFPAFDLALGSFAFEESGDDEGDFGFTVVRR